MHFRHSGRSNSLFVDGHGASLRPSDAGKQSENDGIHKISYGRDKYYLPISF